MMRKNKKNKKVKVEQRPVAQKDKPKKSSGLQLVIAVVLLLGVAYVFYNHDLRDKFISFLPSYLFPSSEASSSPSVAPSVSAVAITTPVVTVIPTPTATPTATATATPTPGEETVLTVETYAKEFGNPHKFDTVSYSTTADKTIGDVISIRPPIEISNYKFQGYFYDKDFSQSIDETRVINEYTTIYGLYITTQSASSPIPTSKVTPTTTSIPDSIQDSNTTMVWVVSGGTKYHNNPNCSDMKNPTEITLQQALDDGFTPCKKCY